MKSLPKLSEASEQRISNALSKVAELIETGSEPNDAIVKIASQEKLPAGQVRLMVRAFNTGRSLEHLRSHDTLEEKAASFKLADATEVLERMFPSKVKTAAEIHNDTVISADYGLSPNWLKRRAPEAASMTKAASAPAPAYDEYPERLQRQTLSQMHDMRRTHDTARLGAIKASYAVVETMDKVAAYFRGNTAMSFAEATHNASCVLGKRVEKLMQKVATDKTVARRYRNDSFDSRKLAAVNWQAEPYNLIKAALAAVDAFAAAQTTLKETEAANTEKRAELMRPFAGDRVAPIYGSVWKEHTKQASGPGMLTYTGATALGNATSDLAKNFAPKSKEELVQESIDKLSDPSHEDKLRAIRTQAMIHELMAGDPILSGYDYNDIIQAYNHLAEVAPKAMQQRVMAQSMLRKYLEQASNLDPFDTNLMLNVDEQIGKRDMPASLEGYRTGPARGLGKPFPQTNMSVDAAKSPKLDEMLFGSRSERGKAPPDMSKQLAAIQSQLKSLRRPQPPEETA